MLFYNENDEICFKDGNDFKVLYERDYFQLEAKSYVYSNGYFYDVIDFGDGEYEVDWQKRTHPRHMDIVEMEEAFAPPSYKNHLDYLFYYKEGISENLNDDEYYVMYCIESKIMEALRRVKVSTYVSVKEFEFKGINGEEGLNKILSLVHEDFPFELYIEDDLTKHDRASITFFLD